MIHGVVNFRYELTLSLVIGNSNGQREFVNTVIDTGFDALENFQYSDLGGWQ
jgi:hypothetical protein